MSPIVQVIKSARVMKKAVAHLIPFMEVEPLTYFQLTYLNIFLLTSHLLDYLLINFLLDPLHKGGKAATVAGEWWCWKRGGPICRYSVNCKDSKIWVQFVKICRYFIYFDDYFVREVIWITLVPLINWSCCCLTTSLYRNSGACNSERGCSWYRQKYRRRCAGLQ